MKTADIQAIWPQWENIGLLGRGRYGRVYLCHSQFDGQDVFSAVKVIDVPPVPGAIEAAKKQGIDEDMLKKYFGKFRDDLNWELSMYKPAAGGELAAIDDCVFEESDDEPGWRVYIRTGVFTPLPVYYGKNRATEEETARMGAALCRACEQLERFGLVHGEITPNNVMVMDSGEFVLTDYGLRRCLDKAGSGLFAPKRDGFDAPEVATYNFINKSSDVYSIGMVMACALCGGVLPKNGYTGKGELGRIIKKATAYNAQERYENASQMRAELEKLIDPAAPIRRATAAATALELAEHNKEKLKAKEMEADPVMTAATQKQQAELDAAERDRQERKRRTVSRIIRIASVIILLAAIATILWVLRPWDKPEKGDVPKEDTHLSQTSDVPGGDNGNSAQPSVPDITGKGEGVENTDEQENKDEQQTTENGEGTAEKKEGGETDEPDPSETVSDDPNASDPGTTPESAENDDYVPGENGGEEDAPSEYLLPSDTEYITADDLKDFDKWQCTLALNELYARHGYKFKDKDLYNYFSSQSWYEPTITSSSTAQGKFNKYERENMNVIINYMKGKGWR